MTENQWPQDDSLGVPGRVPRGTGGPSGGAAGSASKTDAAKDEAAEVKRPGRRCRPERRRDSQGGGGQRRLRGEDQRQGSPAPGQVGPDRPGRHAAAEGRRGHSAPSPRELHTMAAASDQPGVASDLVRQAAERSPVRGVLAGRPGPGLTAGRSEVLRPPAPRHLPAARGRRRRPGRPAGPQPAGRSPRTAQRPPAQPAATRVPDTGMAVPPPPVQMPAPADHGGRVRGRLRRRNPLGTAIRSVTRPARTAGPPAPRPTDPLRDDPLPR